MFCSTILKHLQHGARVNLDYVVKRQTPMSIPRILCCNAETYRFFWPHLFSRSVPAVKSFARWAAGHGACVFPGVRLKMKASGSCCLVATRFIKCGTPLASIPRFLCLEAPSPSDERYSSSVAYEEKYSVLADMTNRLTRHLHDPSSQYSPYVEFLYDVHNIGGEEAISKGGLNTAGIESAAFSNLSQAGKLSYFNQVKLREQLEAFYSGNVVHAKGVPNAPFLFKDDLKTPFGRVEWRRLKQLLREVQQGVPHFAAPSVPWALSMVLSRAIANQTSRHGIIMCPFIDFCEHSYTPSAALHFSHTQKENKKLGVVWHNDDVPCIHLRSVRDIGKGEPITVVYSSQPHILPEDQDYWQVYRGFIPSKSDVNY